MIEHITYYTPKKIVTKKQHNFLMNFKILKCIANFFGICPLIRNKSKKIQRLYFAYLTLLLIVVASYNLALLWKTVIKVEGNALSTWLRKAIVSSVTFLNIYSIVDSIFKREVWNKLVNDLWNKNIINTINSHNKYLTMESVFVQIMFVIFCYRDLCSKKYSWINVIINIDMYAIFILLQLMSYFAKLLKFNIIYVRNILIHLSTVTKTLDLHIKIYQSVENLKHLKKNVDTFNLIFGWKIFLVIQLQVMNILMSVDLLLGEADENNIVKGVIMASNSLVKSVLLLHCISSPHLKLYYLNILIFPDVLCLYILAMQRSKQKNSKYFKNLF